MNESPDNCKNCPESCGGGNKPLSKLQTWGILLLIAVIGVFFHTVSTSKQQQKPQSVCRYTYPCMGTIADISFFENTEISEKAAKAVYNELHKIENMCSIFNPASELSKLNASAADKPFVCSQELYSLLSECKKAYNLTQGTFDITAKPLMNLWGFYSRKKKMPSQAEISRALEYVGLDKVKFNDNDRSVSFSVKGISFDLGGVAKGAALDAAVNAAKNAGAKNGIINLGGNIACFGKNRDGNNFFEVGIRDPQKRNAIAKKLRLTDSFCATSGNYERFVVIDGKQFSHIMNPLTGYPVQNMYSATIVTSRGIDSDIFSTSCFILGKDFAEKIIDAGLADNIILIYPENNKVTLKNINKKDSK